MLVPGVVGPVFRAVRPGAIRGPCDSSPSPSATETLRTESRAPSGRSPPPSGRARTASCTKGRPCMAPRRSGWPQPRACARRVEACSELTEGRAVGGHASWARVLPRAGFQETGNGAPEFAALLTPLRFVFAVSGACQEAAEVPVPVHVGPTRFWRGEGRAGGPGGQGLYCCSSEMLPPQGHSKVRWPACRCAGFLGPVKPTRVDLRTRPSEWKGQGWLGQVGLR